METTKTTKKFDFKTIKSFEDACKKENYKYMEEDDIPEGSDEEAWGHGDADEVWKHRFVEHAEQREREAFMAARETTHVKTSGNLWRDYKSKTK